MKTLYGSLVPMTLLAVIGFAILCLAASALGPSIMASAPLLLDEQVLYDPDVLVQVYPEPMELQVSEHGLNTHKEAAAIQASCNGGGIYQTWKSKFDAKKYYYLCKLDGNKWGIIPFLAGAAEGFTAFSPGSGSWLDTINYLARNATRFMGEVK